MANIHPEGARHYWARNTWNAPQFERNNHEIDKLSELVSSQIKERGFKRPVILEIGCGSGDLTLDLMSRLNSIGFYHCVDVNEDSLKNLVYRLKKSSYPFSQSTETHCGCFGQDDFSEQIPERADVIVCARMLHHVPDIKVFLSKAREYMNDSGIFVADIVPKTERFKLLHEKYGVMAYGIEYAYLLAGWLASRGVAAKPLTSTGLLRTNNPAVEDICMVAIEAGLKICQGELDQSNHYYRFVAVKR